MPETIMQNPISAAILFFNWIPLSQIKVIVIILLYKLLKEKTRLIRTKESSTPKTQIIEKRISQHSAEKKGSRSSPFPYSESYFIPGSHSG
jgi:hypothetical protein